MSDEHTTRGRDEQTEERTREREGGVNKHIKVCMADSNDFGINKQTRPCVELPNCPICS